MRCSISAAEFSALDSQKKLPVSTGGFFCAPKS
jgi:hypothetical protein